MNKTYYEYVQNRSYFRYLRGLISRFFTFLRYQHNAQIARRKGATIGRHVIMPKSFALKCNSNVVIGDHVSIESPSIDTRSPIRIGNYVIIGKGTEIITASHNIDEPTWTPKYSELIIEDYVWLPTKVLVLPSCHRIGYGAVVGSGSVVVKDVDMMQVVSGNPASFLKYRKSVHSDLVVESLLHGDFIEYRRVYKKKK